MNYIPRKKILVEKHSTEAELEEVFSTVLESCYIISFEQLLPTFLSGGMKSNKLCDLNYFIVRDNNQILIVTMQEKKAESLILLIERQLIHYLSLDLKFDYGPIGQTILNYFKRKTEHKIGLYDINLEIKYRKILEDYLKT